MPRPFLAPGCYGSALAAQVSSPTCQACPDREGCFDLAQRQEPELLTHLDRKLKARGNFDGYQRILAFLSFRKRSNRTVAKSGNARSDALLKRFQDERIDLSAIKTGSNPFDERRHGLHYWMAGFVCMSPPFKPADMAHFVQEKTTVRVTTASLKCEVARFASALVAAGVLERKEKNILCLCP